MSIAIILALGGYLIGSIPFGLVSAYLAGLGDIRQIGSGNIGATNVLRSGHKLAAFTTLIGDSGKGAFVIWLAISTGHSEWAPLAGLAAVIGHCYPLWLRFKGGKGVATAIATIFMLYWPAGLVMALTWLIMSLLFRISSLSALTGFVTASATCLIYYDQWPYVLAIAALSFWRHKENIVRLANGTESRIRLSKKPTDDKSV